MCGCASGWVLKMFLVIFPLSHCEMFYETTWKVSFLFPHFVVCVQRGMHAYIHADIQRGMHTYIRSNPPSSSSQLRSQAVTADCGAIVLMLIEYSMWSFRECLLEQFLWYCIKMCIFFLLISKSDLILGWRLFSGLFPHKFIWSTPHRQGMVC